MNKLVQLSLAVLATVVLTAAPAAASTTHLVTAKTPISICTRWHIMCPRTPGEPAVVQRLR